MSINVFPNGPAQTSSAPEPRMSDDLYDDHILDHYESPYHRGHVEHPTIAHEDENPLCGDQVHLELVVEGDRVKEAWFDGHGCAIS